MSPKRKEQSRTKRRSNTHLLQFREETRCEEQGYRLIAGIDEVGRGCLAGPVVAAAVIMSRERSPDWYRKIRDSKLLTPDQREYLAPLIYEYAVSIGMGIIESDVIDAHGMTYAVYSAMRSAVEKLTPQPDYVLIDYLTVPQFGFPQKGVADGDTLCFSIACASIVAKVFRDHLMVEFDRGFPGYGFAENKGYGTRQHVIGLRNLGPSSIHRRLFEPVRNIAQLSLDEMLARSRELEQNET
jgi:ribonuclease HII